MRISLIVAMGVNRQIGIEGRIPWRLPADLQKFKQITMGHTLIMGRKTFESIGRPLPGRTSLVLTRDKNFKAEGVSCVESLDDAIEWAKDHNESEVFIAGGAQVYASGLPIVQRMYLSLVDYKGEADTFFPNHSMDRFVLKSSEHFPANGDVPSWEFQIWDRR